MRRLRGYALCAAALLVAGCAPTGPGGVPDRASLAGGAVVVGGPRGYCVDPNTYPRGPGRSFAVIASCRNLAEDDAAPPVSPMIVTVTVGAPLPGATLPPAAALAAEMGQRMIGGLRADGMTLTHLAGGGTDVIENGDPRHWRGTFMQGDRLVGLALYAPRGSPLAGNGGAAMLRAVRDRIAELSPGDG